MKNIILSMVLSFGCVAFADDVKCTVKGMHCNGCKEMIEGKVCDETKYSTCEITVDGKKDMGTIHLITKDAAAKVDAKALGKTISESSDQYKLLKCVPKA